MSIAAALTLLSVLGGTGTAHALSGEDFSLHQTAQMSDLVVEGRVVDRRWEQREGIVLTFFEVEVHRSWLGKPANRTIEVVVPGGRLGPDRVLFLPGAPYFEQNEHVLLHLASFDDGAAWRMPDWGVGVLREHDGAALVGGDAFPLAELDCERTQDQLWRVDPETPPEDDGAEPLPEALSWTAARNIAVTCLGGAR